MEPATALLWTYYYLAHHFDQLRQLQRAMEFVDRGLEHTPLLIELYVLKAKILKVGGEGGQTELVFILVVAPVWLMTNSQKWGSCSSRR